MAPTFGAAAMEELCFRKRCICPPRFDVFRHRCPSLILALPAVKTAVSDVLDIRIKLSLWATAGSGVEN
jgi:hypothetical protein